MDGSLTFDAYKKAKDEAWKSSDKDAVPAVDRRFRKDMSDALMRGEAVDPMLLKTYPHDVAKIIASGHPLHPDVERQFAVDVHRRNQKHAYGEGFAQKLNAELPKVRNVQMSVQTSHNPGKRSAFLNVSREGQEYDKGQILMGIGDGPVLITRASKRKSASLGEGGKYVGQDIAYRPLRPAELGLLRRALAWRAAVEDGNVGAASRTGVEDIVQHHLRMDDALTRIAMGESVPDDLTGDERSLLASRLSMFGESGELRSLLSLPSTKATSK